ncbi:flagellum-specific ATP synthase FliI, partial [Paraburkholderia sp. BR14261]
MVNHPQPPSHQTIHTGGLTPLEQELALASFGPLASDPAQLGALLVGDLDIPGIPAKREAREQGAIDAIDAALAADAADAPPGMTDHGAPVVAAETPSAPYVPPANYDPANPFLTSWNEQLRGVRERNALALPLRGCGRLTRAAGLVLEAVG